jgi:glycosyltransferase involved in cell wall biosynthesis
LTDVLLDARMAIRGLGISTFVDRLTEGFAGTPSSARVTVWKGQGGWTRAGRLSTLSRSGLFDVSPRLDPRTRPFDVVHYASNVGSIVPGRNSVLTVHDLLHRHSRRRRDRVTGFLLETSLPRVGRVVAVSERTRREVVDAFPQLAGRVTVIPHGMRRYPQGTVERRHLIAFGGGSDPRKRTELLIAAYDEYRSTTPDPLPLVLLARAGLSGDQAPRLAALGARIVADATGAEVDGLVAAAGAVIYTTTTEGFGLPILEAAEFGTPVVLDASADVATEVLGRHCFGVEGTAPRQWAAAIRRAVVAAPVADALSLPDWPTVAARYLELYAAVAADR